MRGKDAAQAIAATKSWKRDLVAAVRPFSEVWAIKLETLGPIEPASKRRYTEDSFARRYVGRATSKDNRHRSAIYYHAARLHRLDKLLDEIESGTVATPPAEDEPAKAVAPKTARPKRKAGRKSEDPPERIAAVQAAIDEQKGQGLEPNIQGAIRTGLAQEDWDKNPDPGAWERARGRLTKRFGPGPAN